MERAELENAEVAGDDDEEEVEGMEGDFSNGEGNEQNSKIEYNNKGEHNNKEEDISEEENWTYMHIYSNNKIHIW